MFNDKTILVHLLTHKVIIPACRRNARAPRDGCKGTAFFRESKKNTTFSFGFPVLLCSSHSLRLSFFLSCFCLHPLCRWTFSHCKTSGLRRADCPTQAAKMQVCVTIGLTDGRDGPNGLPRPSVRSQCTPRRAAAPAAPPL